MLQLVIPISGDNQIDPAHFLHKSRYQTFKGKHLPPDWLKNQKSINHV